MSEAAKIIDEDDDAAPIDAVGRTLRTEFDEVERERYYYENRWLKDLRQYKGEYEPDVKENFDDNESHAFIRYTRTKVNTMDARGMDMLFPGGTDKNWQIGPTPAPEIPPFKKTELVAAVMESMGEMPTENEIEMMSMELATKAATAMSIEIEDQLTEGKYVDVIRDVMHSGHLYGTGVLKGPMVEVRPVNRYVQKGGEFVLDEVTRMRPYFEFVSLWDTYPDLSSDNLEDGDFVWQRHVMNKQKLRRLAKRKSFMGQRIRDYLRLNPEGDAQLKRHEMELMRLKEDEEYAPTDRKKKYEVLERWGYMDGQDLKDAGLDIDDKDLDLEFEANIWLLGDIVIKAVLNPTEQQQRPYHFYYYEKDETSIFGAGIPMALRDPQSGLNGAMRAAMNNAAFSAMPTGEINESLLAAGEDPEEMYPGKMFIRKGTGIDSQYDAVRFHNVNANVSQFLKLAEEWKKHGDEASAIPSYMHGEQGKGVQKTVGGLSMLMGAANITLKDVIRNFDEGITKPFISAMYHWNMQWNDNRGIKGDYEVKAVGSTSLIAKEVRAQQLDNMLQILSGQMFAPFVKWYDLLVERFKAGDLPVEAVLVDKKEAGQIIEAMKSAMAQGAPEGAPA